MKHMKLYAVLIAGFLFLGGCASVYPPPADPVCASPEAVGSVICATAARIGLTPEQIDAAFLDAALIGIGTKVIQAEALRKAVTTTRVWVVERDVLTIDSLVKYLIKESSFEPALALLLSRRLGLINLPDLGIKPVTSYDKALIIAGLDSQLEQLSWF